MILITANPFSGSGPNRQRVEALAAELERRGMGPRVVWDRGERDALLADRAATAGCRCVVVAGGDGTIGDIVNLRSDLPIATLPVGNENLFAQHMSFDFDVARLVRAIERGAVRRMDLGVIRRREASGQFTLRRFTLMASAGLDAAVVHRLTAWRAYEDSGKKKASPERPGLKGGGHSGGGGGSGGARRRVRRMTYVRPVVACLWRYGFPTIELEADGRSVRGAHALVFNLPRYGGNLKFAPDADETDGMLDWVVFERPGALASLSYGLSVLRGSHRSRADVRHGRSARIALRLAGAGAAPLQADGDAVGMVPVELSVDPGGLGVIDMRGV